MKIPSQRGPFFYFTITSDLIEKYQFSTTSPTKAEWMNLAKTPPFPQWFALANLSAPQPATNWTKKSAIGKVRAAKAIHVHGCTQNLREGLRKIRTCTLWVVHLANSFM